MAKPKTPEENWREYLTGKHPTMLMERRLMRWLPKDPRCKLCNSPFRGAGGFVMRMMGKARSSKNPGPGEILMSDAAYTAAGLDLGTLEHRQLELKGRTESIGVRVLRIAVA